MARLKQNTPKPVLPPFKVGDLVTTEYYTEDAQVIRRVVKIEADAECESTWRVWADGGVPCPHCGRDCCPINGVDSGWFKPVQH